MLIALGLFHNAVFRLGLFPPSIHAITMQRCDCTFNNPKSDKKYQLHRKVIKEGTSNTVITPDKVTQDI